MGAIFKNTIYVGDHVEKVDGYKWPGEVRAVFTTLKGETRIVVECISADVAGALNIFSPDQVRVLAGPEFVESLKRLHGLL